jgi:formate hydrogenlyase subunit 4
MIGWRLVNVLAMLVMPFLLVGIVNRVKSLWSGRRGAPIFQLLFDVLRLMRKRPVYSDTTTALFRIAPWVFLVTCVGSAAIAPLIGGRPVASFSFDFVWFAYVWGLGRVALMLAALDTGSSFEGMGAAREALFSAILEPALFLVAGSLTAFSDTHTLYQAVMLHQSSVGYATAWLASVFVLFIVIQVETGRMPIDDPTTHLELTMAHEVMILDHSGPDLAAVQTGSAIKLFVGTSILACLMNPFSGQGNLLCAVVNLGLSVVLAILIGTVESVIARLKLRAVPQYIAVGLASATVALLSTLLRTGTTP